MLSRISQLAKNSGMRRKFAVPPVKAACLDWYVYVTHNWNWRDSLHILKAVIAEFAVLDAMESKIVQTWVPGMNRNSIHTMTIV